MMITMTERSLTTCPILAKNEFIKELTELENIRTVEQNEYEKKLQEKKRRALS